jgi:2-hydroxychromene-2-carboxylate isomerase
MHHYARSLAEPGLVVVTPYTPMTTLGLAADAGVLSHQNAAQTYARVLWQSLWTDHVAHAATSVQVNVVIDCGIIHSLALVAIRISGM